MLQVSSCRLQVIRNPLRQAGIIIKNYAKTSSKTKKQNRVH